MGSPRNISALSATNSDDEAAIEAVIHLETQAFMAADFKAWASCFVQDERLREVCMNSTAGLNVISGWNDFEPYMQHVLDNDLGCRMVRYRKDNMQISVSENTAWVVYNGWAENEDGNTWENFTTCFLERTCEGWKIAYHSFADIRDADAHEDQVSVDKGGRLIWGSPQSLEKLARHSILTVSAGRLRARRRDWDRELQEALAHAGQYHGFFELRRFTDDARGPLNYPVVLGDTDDGGVAVVQVSVHDSTTYVQIDVAGSLDRRLATAQAVFGLSDGQLRIARKIALGESMKSASEALGISINTARTHLTRIYEKTGVSNQASLVRLLLSVG